MKNLGVRRFKCVCAYDGTAYCGWQSQPSGKSVQDYIERRLKGITGQQIRIHGSGRTDAGVHAKAQVFHFDLEWNHSVMALARALGGGHNKEIQIYKVEVVSDKFHARFSAKGKRYVYRIFEGLAKPDKTRYVWSTGRGARKLDVKAMNAAAAVLVGTHDFSAFGANRKNGKKDNPVKQLRVLKVSKSGRNITIATEGSGYLYKMVRMLTGALVEVGKGKLDSNDIKNILETRQRGALFAAAAANGLTLEKVFY